MPSGDVFPRRNLPPEAEQWGREVEKRVSGAEQALEISGQSLSGLNRNTASSLANLADQIVSVQEQQAELAQRRTYSKETTITQRVNVGDAVPWMGDTESEVQFTLDSRRTVRADFSVFCRNFVVYDGSSPAILPTISTRIHFVWSENPSLGIYTPVFQQVAAREGQNSFISSTQRVQHWDLLKLEPGNYRVGVAPEVVALQGVSGYVEFQNPKLMVDVIGPW